MNDGGWFAIVAPLLAAFVVVGLVWSHRRSAAMLERHLRDRGYRLVERQYRWLARGPFFWNTRKGQAVYRFTAEHSGGGGDRRFGWARCGGYLFGLLTDRVDVRWDDDRGESDPAFPVIVRDEQR
jgi:hypothetical protein